MARAETVSIRCDRCSRVDVVETKEAKKPVSFVIRIGDVDRLRYEDLCERCDGIVNQVVETALPPPKRDVAKKEAAQ